ncbi:MAG: HAD family hydrolase [Mariprofundaceae bacterium]
MSKIQAVLLDMDGTLVDAFAPIVRAMNLTLQEFGLQPLSELDIRRHTGKGDCSMTALFGDQKAAAGQYFLKVHDEDYLSGVFALPGAQDLLIYLQENHIPAAIVTSKGQLRAEAQLEHLGWRDKIQLVIGKVDGRASKPNPESLFLACDQLNVKPQNSIMVGDGTADMQAAQRANSLAIGITHSFSKQELEQAGAQHTFSNLIEVARWLKTQIH